MTARFSVNQQVLLNHGGAKIPAIVRELKTAGSFYARYRLEVIGDNIHRPWQGLHWFSEVDISPAERKIQHAVEKGDSNVNNT